jgi:ribosomal protein L2
LTKPYKKFIICQTLDNFNIIIPGIEYLNLGKIMYNYNFYKNYGNHFFYKGFIAYLYMIPNTVMFCNLSNLCNNKLTYAKSGGTFCKTKKTKKTKKKLLTVVLPSQKEILLNKMSVAYIGKNENFRVNDLTEGK